MARLVFHLANVPEDEAMQVRQALTEAEVEFFETEAGRWRIGVAAIWVHTDDDVPAARQAIEAVQAELPRAAPLPFWHHVALNPVRVLSMLVLIAAIIAITLIPVWMLIN
ncbi:DUF6164 family protein [Salinibius halmophilus]|uniref:DUF6164 family protein n=1 Tax=Salinibius halmophilus TaxID=1853216 RepID=UPI000E66E5B8|nr:DUF6164 family protein [Salinibius halmophilus]